MDDSSCSDTAAFRLLLRLAFLGLLVSVLLVSLCFFYVDRQVAFFVRDHQLNNYPFLLWLTYPPMLLNSLAPILTLLAALRRAAGPLSRLERTLLASSLSLMVAIAFEYYLKFLFGRYWPATWIHDNPSLLGTGDYGFHPFHFGEAYGSFPSGHTARVFAALSVVALAYPSLRWVCLLASLSVVLGLVGMNYHFVGDTVGGIYLGSVTGAYTASWFGLLQTSRPSSPDQPDGSAT